MVRRIVRMAVRLHFGDAKSHLSMAQLAPRIVSVQRIARIERRRQKSLVGHGRSMGVCREIASADPEIRKAPKRELRGLLCDPKGLEPCYRRERPMS